MFISSIRLIKIVLFVHSIFMNVEKGMLMNNAGFDSNGVHVDITNACTRFRRIISGSFYRRSTSVHNWCFRPALVGYNFCARPIFVQHIFSAYIHHVTLIYIVLRGCLGACPHEKQLLYLKQTLDMSQGQKEKFCGSTNGTTVSRVGRSDFLFF